jgi:hypothetical protein
MAGTNVDALNGLYHEVAGELVDALPEAGTIGKLVPFRQSDRIGDSYHEAIVLTRENGFSYGGTAGDAFTLRDPLSMATKDAVVGAYHYCMTSSISLPAVTRAQNAGKQAFASAISTVVENAYESAAQRLEISYLHGGRGIGDVPDTSSSVETTSTTATLVFSAATWAPGIWAGNEGAEVYFYDLDNLATLISSGADSIFTVTSVANSTRTVVVTGTAAGIDALDIAVQGGGVRCFFYGSRTNDMTGLGSILSNTGSLFSIDAATYGLWRGNSFDAAGELTMDKVLDYVADLVGRGLKGDVKLLLNPFTWARLNSELNALRNFDASYKGNKQTSGTKEIEYLSQNGTISIISDNLVKGGEAFLIKPEYLKRIGSAENDKMVATQDKNPFYPLATQAGFGFRVFSDLAIYSQRPAVQGYISGIVN